MSIKCTTEKFIEKAKLIHGDKYDYSLVEYVKNTVKVKIICQIHGIFEQTPTGHLNSNGCKKCCDRLKANTKSINVGNNFIANSKKTHGDKYDYSKTKYVNAITKVTITCLKHGDFYQIPTSHMSGVGCPKCANNIKHTNNSFINKAKLIHGNKFDYSKVEYVNAKDKIIIICPKHGEFEQKPSKHLCGDGCPKCANQNVTTEEFIAKANIVHNNKYDYRLTKYSTKNTIPVKIICPIHGEFEQRPDKHLSGCGCQKCGIETKGKSKTENYRNSFIDKANIIHNNKYDYSKSNCVNSKTKIIIICPIHGEFEQTPDAHLQGSGCRKCAGVYTPTTEEWILKAKKVHGNIYDYSKVKYKKQDSKIEIVCKKHGIFTQTPNSHLRGSGCPRCSGRAIDYLPFEEAREFIRKLEFKSKKEWDDYCKSGNKPEDIPTHPDFVYKKKK